MVVEERGWSTLSNRMHSVSISLIFDNPHFIEVVLPDK